MLTPKHDARRRKVAKVVMNVIARDGFDAVTVRRIAGEVGFSTAVVSHYFAGKQDLLLSAYGSFDAFPQHLHQELCARDPADLVGYLVALSAAGEAGQERWRAFLAIWDQWLRNAVFVDKLRNWINEALLCIEAIIKVRNPGRADTRELAERLLAIAQGVSMQALANPERWSGDRLRHALQSEVKLLLGEPDATAPTSSG